MATHGFGIIGCGMIAEFHTKAINEIPGAAVVAAYTRTPANGEKVARLATGECRIYDDLDAMLAQLRAKGANVTDETQDFEGIGRFGWVTDPEGNRIELWQPS